MKSGLLSFILFATWAYISASSFASSDSTEWKLLGHDPDPEFTQMGSQIGTAYLHPWNDTRINLKLLLQDQGRFTPQSRSQMPAFDDDLAPMGGYAEPKQVEDGNKIAVLNQLPRLKIPPEVFNQAQSRINNWREGRCVSDSWASVQQYLSQLELAGLTEEEIRHLGTARLNMAGTCPASQAVPVEVALTSPKAAEFELYLKAAAAFYAGKFSEAAETFKLLAEAKTAWLQETAQYMLGRVYLNLAQQGAADSWGLFAKDAINSAQLSNAEQAFNAYLKNFPTGVYAASARGLARKIAWLGQNQAQLAILYGGQFKEAMLAAPSDAAVALINEIDNRHWFFAANNSAGIFSREPNWQIPEFAAVAVLARQRIIDTSVPDKDKTAPYALSAEALKTSIAEFKKNGQEKLGHYLLLSHQFFVLRNYPAVVEATANLEITDKLSNLDFSAAYLRGLALEKTQQKEKAYAHWKTLAEKAKSDGARIQSQIAFAIHLAENDRLKDVFAENSLITFAPIRKPAIIYSANAQVLEFIMQVKHTSADEKRAALMQLARKNLQHQQYAEALRLIKLYPLENYNLGDIYSQDHAQNPSAAKLLDNLQQYLDNPKDLMALVNLAGRYQNYHLTDLTPAKLAPGQVGGVTAKWAGEIKSTLQVFQQIIDDNSTPAEVKAKALSGAINCFRRTGANRCDAQDIPASQRKAWFTTLKKTYGKSQWAEAQSVYW